LGQQQNMLNHGSGGVRSVGAPPTALSDTSSGHHSVHHNHSHGGHNHKKRRSVPTLGAVGDSIFTMADPFNI